MRLNEKLLRISDFCERWNYTKAGIHKLAKPRDFPVPIGRIAKGRIKIFLEEGISIYKSMAVAF
jgi:predicted DNA-binding transcriptional regulator AlpA